MTAAPDRLTRLARALAVVTTRPPVATASVALQLRNPLNGGGLSTSRGSRMASNARRKAERAKGGVLAFRIGLEMHGWKPITDPRVVVLTRVSPKPFDDDNNAAALKSVRDGMAEAWGINDADPRVMWVTDWRKGKAHAVEAALWMVPEVDAVGTLAYAPMPSDVEVDPSSWERPRRVVVHGGLIQRREVRVTPNVVSEPHHPEPSMSRTFERGDDFNEQEMKALRARLNGDGPSILATHTKRVGEMRVTPNVIRNKGGA